MKDPESITKRPEFTNLDVVHTTAKALISALPGVGGPATELFLAIFKQPLETRRDKWVESIASGLVDMQKRVDGLEFAALQQNQTFITTALHASQVSIRNHQTEKLAALRNAVLNAALPGAPEDYIQALFLSYVDTLTALHLSVLSYFDNPGRFLNIPESEWSHWTTDKQYEGLTQALPGIGESLLVLGRIEMDLRNRGLTELVSLVLPPQEDEPETTTGRVTRLGKAFICFISEPELAEHPPEK